MTVRAKAGVVFALLVSAYLSAWGARELFGTLLNPVVRALGS